MNLRIHLRYRLVSLQFVKMKSMKKKTFKKYKGAVEVEVEQESGPEEEAEGLH